MAQPFISDVRTRFTKIKNYVVYYGHESDPELLRRLKRYQLAILNPQPLNPNDFHHVNVPAVAYLSIGEVPKFEDDGMTPFHWLVDLDGSGPVVPATWLLGSNDRWGSYFVDVREQGWQELMISEARRLLSGGFDGLFLDTVDTADEYPETRDGMVGLITLLRSTFPNAGIIQNRGFGVVDRTSTVIDAVMYEDLSSHYDPHPGPPSMNDPGRYTSITDPSEICARTELVAWLQRLGLENGTRILSLDYAVDADTARQYADFARRQHFVPFVSVGMLDSLPNFD